MGTRHLRLLAIWAFLSAVFTTFSLAAASSEGSAVFCVVKTSVGDMIAMLEPNAVDARAYVFNHAHGGYLCTDPIPVRFLAEGVKLRLFHYGDVVSQYWKANVAYYPFDDLRISRLSYLRPEDNTLFVVFVADGTGYAVVDDALPKDFVDDYTTITGDVTIVNPDPVLRIYLRAERGKLDIQHYSVGNYDHAELPRPQVSIRFAACSLRVSNFKAWLSRVEGKEYIAGRFYILGDDNAPLLIPSVSVSVGESSINPQYSPSDRSYAFFAPYTGKEHYATISADVPGCSHFEYRVELKVRGNVISPAVLLLIGALVFAGVVFWWSRH